MKLITARVFDNIIDAHLLKTKLESEGINCYIYDENTVTLHPLISNAVGGIKLKIEEPDTERVIELLKQIENTPYKDENNELVKCPKCDSSNLISGYKSMKGLSGILSFIVSFLMMIYPFHYKVVYKCNDCDNEFKIFN